MSGLIVLRDSKDVVKIQATRFLERIKERSTVLLTTNFIFDAVCTYFSRFQNVAVELGGYIRNSPGIIIYYRVTSDDENHAWEILKGYRYKTFSFTDCTSFANCERLEIMDAFTFDKQLKRYGKFNVLP